MKKKISPTIVVSLSLLIALVLGTYITFANGQPSMSRRIPERQGAGISEVIAGTALIVPFEFMVDRGTSRLKIEIAHEDMKKMGIFLSDSVVKVKYGKAFAKAYFTLEKEAPPERFTLKRVAKDAATEKVIGRGSIPFAVYPSFYNMLKCSC